MNVLDAFTLFRGAPLAVWVLPPEIL